MKLQFLAAAAAAILTTTAAGAAMAETLAAKLQEPVPAKTKLIAGGAVFVCEGDTCVANAATSRTFATVACKELAKEVGPLAGYGNDRRALDAAKLDQCNAVAGPATQVAKR
ncbi:MAG: CC_3452 family protein [Phenylobacterium sp.]|uniref:CC_3452 family protein n=1 Tax=Phenylobacterium sp. TaxID=1871053 RepID=UPI0039195681